MRSLLVGVVLAAPFVVGAASAAPFDDTARGHEVTRFADPEIVESSGLVVGGGLAVTMNDSGDTARVFTVDLKTGQTVGVTHFDGKASDLESLAPAGNGQIWVGDTGDNNHDRSDIEVTRVPVGRGDRHVTGETFHLQYPGDPEDAEALLADPRTGRLYVVTKGPFRGHVYAAPERLDPAGENQLQQVAEAPAMVTDGAFYPDGKHVLMRNYRRAFLYSFPGFRPLADFTLPSQKQGEGLAIDGSDTVYLSSEGAGQPVLRVDLPPAAEAALRGLPAPRPTPAQGSASGQDGGGRGGRWVPVLFGALGVVMLGGIVKVMRG